MMSAASVDGLGAIPAGAPPASRARYNSARPRVSRSREIPNFPPFACAQPRVSLARSMTRAHSPANPGEGGPAPPVQERGPGPALRRAQQQLAIPKTRPRVEPGIFRLELGLEVLGLDERPLRLLVFPRQMPGMGILRAGIHSRG